MCNANSTTSLKQSDLVASYLKHNARNVNFNLSREREFENYYEFILENNRTDFFTVLDQDKRYWSRENSFAFYNHDQRNDEIVKREYGMK